MIYDTETGKIKKPVEGKCIICNRDQQRKVFGAGYCLECLSILHNESEVSKRIVWE